MDDLECTGNEQHIQDCHYETTDDCGANEGAGVECFF